MRVGLVVYGDLNQVSGGYLYDRKIAEYLESRGDDVVVFNQPRRAYPARPIETLNLSFWRRLASSNVDVLLQDELNHASLAIGNRWLRRHIEAPIVSIVHHLRAREQRPTYSKAVSRALERLYLRTTDARVYSSRATKRSVESLAGSRPSVVARPSGRRFGAPIGPEEISDRAKADGSFRVLFVGNVIPRKRLHLLIEGLAQIPAQHWRLDVVGDESADPSYVTDIRRRIRGLDDPSSVTVHGQLSDDTLQRLFRESHVLAVPSTYEGYGIVYVEGMGHGLPVLASPNGGVRDIVTDGENGVFVETAAEIADAVDGWIRNRGRLATMGRAAADYYQSTPTWNETGERVAAFLDRIAADSSSDEYSGR